MKKDLVKTHIIKAEEIEERIDDSKFNCSQKKKKIPAM